MIPFDDFTSEDQINLVIQGMSHNKNKYIKLMQLTNKINKSLKTILKYDFQNLKYVVTTPWTPYMELFLRNTNVELVTISACPWDLTNTNTMLEKNWIKAIQ